MITVWQDGRVQTPRAGRTQGDLVFIVGKSHRSRWRASSVNTWPSRLDWDSGRGLSQDRVGWLTRTGGAEKGSRFSKHLGLEPAHQKR